MKRDLILLSSSLYLASFLLGYSAGFHVYYSLIPLRSSGYSDKLFFEIFRNNTLLVLQLLISWATFGLYTATILCYNGAYFGFMFRSYPELSILALPHGIFEIPAIIIAGAAGFKIPYEIVRYLSGRKERILTKEDIKEYLTLALISFILTVIAAFIEAYITPRVAEYFLK